MSLGRHVWLLRKRVLGPERVVTKDRVAEVARSRALRWRGRSRVRGLLVHELALGPPRRARIAVGDARIELGGTGDFPIDWKTFVDIFADEPYAAPYLDAHVLDVGAHKGYFGAYALASGASAVVSFEPEARNYNALARAAQPLGQRWLTRNAALGSMSGEGTLLLDQTSWGHSMVRVNRPAGAQPVEVVTLDQALAELEPGGSRTIVKIDAEGSECDILSRFESVQRADLLFVEWHSEKAPCSRHELTQAIESAGFTQAPDRNGVLRYERNPSEKVERP